MSNAYYAIQALRPVIIGVVVVDSFILTKGGKTRRFTYPSACRFLRETGLADYLKIVDLF